MAGRGAESLARRVTLRMQSQDTRKYLLNDAVRRVRNAAVRSGGRDVTIKSPKKRIERWCVNRSPHVNKTSREHFWMITHTRIVKWHAGNDVDLDSPYVIAQNLPDTVATRVQDDMPALMALPVAWDLMHSPPAAAERESVPAPEAPPADLAPGEEAGTDSKPEVHPSDSAEAATAVEEKKNS